MGREMTEIDEGERCRRAIKKKDLRKMDEQLDLLWAMQELKERAKVMRGRVSNQDGDDFEGEKEKEKEDEDEDEDGEGQKETVGVSDIGDGEGQKETVGVSDQDGEGEEEKKAGVLGQDDWEINRNEIMSTQDEWEINLNEITFQELIAKDNFAQVYKGFYDGQNVTVTAFEWREKVQTPSNESILQRSSFKEKVSFWYKIDHPNILKLIGAKIDEAEFELRAENDESRALTNMSYVVVEYLCGDTLKSFLSKSKSGEDKPSFKIVIQLALDLARGLACLHSRKLTHGNVTPENMLLDSNLKLKITDFNAEIPKHKELACDTGTITYMAPEVIDSKPYDKKCDIYSFGICLWEMYCCDMPYPDLSFSELTSAIFYQNLRPRIPEDCPKALANLMQQCWDSDSSKRPEMEEVVWKLEAIDTSKGKKLKSLHSCFCFHK